ncbi:MAG: deoxynucleoside kinase [Desulfobacterales bacterium]|jgi:deoxyadenosine/deoxycytidine kinase|nr:deoxynucleoside kinase [Desulfobacterales bacterium]
MMFQYIVIEGPIGVGKTSLTRLVAKEFNARLILEKPEENPFLPQFYRDRKKYAFQTQISFLLNRFQQQREIAQYDLFNQITLSDYLFAKDRIFSSMNLDDHELALYDQIYSLLNGQIPTPDLVIFLQAKPEVLHHRIKSRNIAYEKDVDLEYLKTLTEAYNYYFFHYDQGPLLVVDTSEIDFVNRKEDFNQLIREIKQMKKGTWYFIPMKSK